MATAIVVFHYAGNKSFEGDSVPVIRLPEARAEVVATGASSVQTTLKAVAMAGARKKDGGFVTVFAVGANLWVTSGSNPTAAKPAAGNSGTGFPVLSGTDRTFAVNPDDEIALIEWA